MVYLYPETIVPEGQPGATTGKLAAWEALGKRLNRDDVFVPVKADGVTDNTGIITGVMDEVPSGTVLRFPRGPIACNPFTVSKMLHLRGAGRFSTRFIPLTNSTSPLITFNRTIDSGNGIFDNYGPSIADLAIYRNGHMAGPCLSLTNNTAWMQVRGILCSGGTKSVLHRAPNASFDDVLLWDCSDCMIDLTDEGLELHLRKVVMSAQVQSVNTYIRLTMTVGGGLKGALYMDDVTGNSSNLVTVSNGMTMVAPAALSGPWYTEIPTFCEKLILDNVNGGGHVLSLTNIATFSLVNSWLNGTSGCVKMDGCVNPHFTNVRYRGGTHTYEFTATRATTGFQSEGCETATAPVYKVGASNKPDTIWTNDNIRGATDIGQVTNDPAWFEAASRRTWGARRFQGTLRRREAGTAPPSGYAVLSGGTVTVNHPLVGVNTRVRVWHERPGTSPGFVYSSVLDNIAGTSFKIKSTSGADNAGVYWEFVGDAD